MRLWFVAALVLGAATGAPLVAACRDEVAPLRAAAGDIRVLEVQDGDSLRLDVGAADVKVRLFGIDAPEKDQPWGDAARDALKALVAGRALRLVQEGSDRYGRLLVKLYADGSDASVNEQMVAGGFAWHYVRYSKDAALAEAERIARLERRGLWRDDAPTAPWDFRASRRGDAPAAVVPAPDVSNTVPGAAEQAAVIGNVRSRKYHVLGCPGYRATAPSNRVPFESPEAAEVAGFKRAGNCP